uniref:Alliinase n=1 Tax=Allium tuberosum TaxID=4683 RepID=O04927_ALLTU|nr:alliinase [Allium tuberosum]
METYKPGNKMPYLIILLCVSFPFFNTVQTLSWTLKAAEEAEAVAAIKCSGHGRAYQDGVLSKGSPICECNTCYEGSDCSTKTPNCSADVASGDALFLEEYWKDHKENTAVLVSGWHRMSYFFPEKDSDFMSAELKRTITELHEIVGNAETKGKHIVFGVGVTQLLHGLVLTISPNISNCPTAGPAKVVARAPYYAVFRDQTSYFDNKGYEWKGNAANYVNDPNPNQFIELVTSPNNPEGNLRKAMIVGSTAIYDMVYYWPHFTPITYKADEDIMLFTMSKYTGHSGSRFGWAIIKDENVAIKLVEFMSKNTEGTSRETQLRTLILLKEVIAMIKTHKGTPKDINFFGFQHLRQRWEKVTELLDQSNKRFSYQHLNQSEHCNYMRMKRPPSPSYAWVRCNWPGEENCSEVFKEGGIITQDGPRFEAGSQYVRLSLIKTNDDFDQMMDHLKKMIKEKRPTVIKEISGEVDKGSRRPFI